MGLNVASSRALGNSWIQFRFLGVSSEISKLPSLARPTTNVLARIAIPLPSSHARTHVSRHYHLRLMPRSHDFAFECRKSGAFIDHNDATKRRLACSARRARCSVARSPFSVEPLASGIGASGAANPQHLQSHSRLSQVARALRRAALDCRLCRPMRGSQHRAHAS